MKKDEQKLFGVWLSPELHYKLFYMAEYDGRSGNRQMRYILQQYIAQFEKEHGEIPAPEKD